MIINNFLTNNIRYNLPKNTRATLCFKAQNSNYSDTYNHATRCFSVIQNSIPVDGSKFPKEYITEINGKYYLKDCYTIIHLESSRFGGGKRALQNVLKMSLANPKTNGRIILYAENISNTYSPAGFYYKLGFRFRNNDEYNDLMAKWLKTSGLKATAPQITGAMYLPKENIKHCLHY